MYKPSMRICWILAILFVLVSCGEKSAEQSGALNPTQVGKPPISTNPDSSSDDQAVSIFETEELKNSLKQVELKERILLDRGYRMKKNEDGTYSWEVYKYKNELGGTLTWQEGVFITKFRTKVGGPTHDLITGEELPHFSEEMTLYHTQPVFEFLNLDNWPKLEKFLGETQDAIVAHYNKYMNDLDEDTKKDLEAKYNRVVSAYNNAKGHAEYLSLPVMTWEEIINKYELKDMVWISKELNFIPIVDKMMRGESVKEYAEKGLIKLLENESKSLYQPSKKFRVISTLFIFIQEI